MRVACQLGPAGSGPGGPAGGGAGGAGGGGGGGGVQGDPEDPRGSVWEELLQVLSASGPTPGQPREPHFCEVVPFSLKWECNSPSLQAGQRTAHALSF